MNWWAVKWKSYSVAELLVNEKQKEYIESEWTKEPENRRSQQFTLAGETYSYNSIDSITRTSSKIDNALKLLYSNEAESKNKSVIFNSDGEAVTSWYKKSVTRKEYDNYYGKHPSYYTLSKDNTDIWVAFRIVKKSNGDRPDNVEPCTEGESERLWQKISY